MAAKVTRENPTTRVQSQEHDGLSPDKPTRTLGWSRGLKMHRLGRGRSSDRVGQVTAEVMTLRLHNEKS